MTSNPFPPPYPEYPTPLYEHLDPVPPPIPRQTAMAASQLPDPPELVVEIYDRVAGRDQGPVVGCCGPAEAVAAWIRAYADLLAPATRVRYHGIHPTTHDEGDR